jgi:ABC-type lipoprotein release transport system permease subunit
MEGLLFGVEAGDPVTLGVVALGLLAASALATWVPAWRGTRIDPIEAVRAE